MEYPGVREDVPRIRLFANDEVEYRITDHLASVRSTLDGTGAITHTYDYKPFGSLFQGGPEARQSFNSREKDQEAGLYNNGVRKLEDDDGRFTSIDPLWERFSAWSPYQYGYNNPLTITDPGGMQGREAMPLPSGAYMMVIATNVGIEESNSSASSTSSSTGNYESVSGSSTESGSSASGTSSKSGHAWIIFYDMSGQATTYATYGNTGTQEFWQDREIESGTNEPVISRSVMISADQVKKVNKFNADPENTNWTIGTTCAGYASALWNYITGENLSASDFLGSSTSPSALSESIYHANGNQESKIIKTGK